MSSVAVRRTWTAVLVARSYSQPGLTERIDADPQPLSDTLREQHRAAVAEARELVLNGLADEVQIELYKTTKARGTEFDRSGGEIWTEDGRIYTEARI